MLDDLNYRNDVINEDGEIVPRIQWSCSCLQGMCGACAMVINGRPALACETFLRDLGNEITLEPLSKFPVVCDLISRRTALRDASMKKEYDAHFGKGCSKSLACMDVCPMKIPTLTSMAIMNRG